MDAIANLPEEGIYFYDNPLTIDRYKFLYEHMDCDSIIESKPEDDEDGIIYVLAYAIKKEFNKKLEALFYNNNYSGRYVILRGIDSKEAGSID